MILSLSLEDGNALRGEREWFPESAQGKDRNTGSFRDNESLAQLEQRIFEGKW